MCLATVYIAAILFLSYCLPCSFFLFDTVTPSSGYYQDLLDLLHDEQRQRDQLEKYIVRDLQTEIQILRNESAILGKEAKKLQQLNSDLRLKIVNLNGGIALLKQGGILKDDIENDKLKTARDLQNMTDRIRDIFFYFSQHQGEINSNISTMKQRLSTNSKSVQIQACGGFYLRYNGSIVFSKLNMTSGFQGLSSFRKDGIFRCEKSGLYLIITSLTSVDSESRYSIVKNNNTILAKTQIVPQHNYLSYMFHTGTTSAVVNLITGDTISVKSDKNIQLFGDDSCFSLVLLK